MRLLALLSLLLFALSAALLSYRLPLLEAVLPPLLTRAGLAGVELELQSVERDQLVIGRAVASLAPPKGSLRLELGNTTIHYRLGQLLRGGVDQIVIKRLSLRLPAASAPKGPESSFPERDAVRKLLTRLEQVELPCNSLTIEQLLIQGAPLLPETVQPPAAEISREEQGLEARLELRLSAREQFELRVQHLRSRPLRLELIPTLPGKQKPWLQLSLQPERLQGTVELPLEPLGRLFPQGALPPLTGRLQGSFSLELADPLALRLELRGSELGWGRHSLESFALQLAGASPGPGRVELLAGSRLSLSRLSTGSFSADRLQLGLASILQQRGDAWQLRFKDPPPWQGQGLRLGSSQLAKLQLPPPRSLGKAGRSLTLELRPKTEIRAQDLTLGASRIPSLHCSLTRGKPALFSLQPGSWQLSSPPWQSGALQLHHPQGQVELAPFTLTPLAIRGQEEQTRVHLEISAPALSLRARGKGVSFKKLRGEIRLEEERLQALLHCQPHRLEGSLELSLVHRLDLGQGRAELSSSEAIVFSEQAGLEQLVEGVELPLEFNSGRLMLRAEAGWFPEAPPRVIAGLQLNQAGGMLRGFPFQELSLDHSLELSPGLHSLQPGRLSLQRLETPVPLESIQADLQLVSAASGPWPLLVIEGLRASLFEGQLHGRELRYDPNSDSQALTLEASELALPAMVGLLKLEGLEVSGTIDAHLPLSLDQEGLRLSEGRLSGSARGGTIRFRPPAGTTPPSQFSGYVLKALEEFHYTRLRAPVSYQPDGTLVVELQLEGKSPALSASRAVHLNIRTEQNLLSLLRSLQYNSKISRELENRLQQHR
ncbi:intermembrane phospholipid transport protein YdbH family protein [Desulfogranum mediterraneum]|uniref:intermembrane phospholipid transport protein YdbH family protein n=1 Tax=Desulfogranum mediterraneum TaxID=160661 RepID=UPI000417F831|nr:YdbH domain-containing protein [Desulfogranum mediterraneum]